MVHYNFSAVNPSLFFGAFLGPVKATGTLLLFPNFWDHFFHISVLVTLFCQFLFKGFHVLWPRGPRHFPQRTILKLLLRTIFNPFLGSNSSYFNWLQEPSRPFNLIPKSSMTTVDLFASKTMTPFPTSLKVTCNKAIFAIAVASCIKGDFQIKFSHQLQFVNL